MKTSFFDYHISRERIAQKPSIHRSSSRLLDVRGDGTIEDRYFLDLPSMVDSRDLLIFNDTRVLRARLTAHRRPTGGRIEILVERRIDHDRFLAKIRSSNKLQAGVDLETPMGSRFLVEGRDRSFYCLRITSNEVLEVILDREGQIPLPPYIRRSATLDDQDQYQTIYARTPGAVAAPTAGLHFDDKLFVELKRREVAVEFVTLHVGSGTFQPIREDDIEDHEMHSEWISVPERVVRAIDATRKRGGRIVAIGTTVVRALESAARTGKVACTEGYTNLYIVPGFRFQVVDVLVTNFHQPRSSLFILVCAFFGLKSMQEIYSHAIEKGYRFYSYGDAMRLERKVVA